MADFVCHKRIFQIITWHYQGLSVILQRIIHKIIITSVFNGKKQILRRRNQGNRQIAPIENAGNRLQQKQIRHDLRVDYEFNISDFNEPGKAFGEEELQAAIKRGAIQILDDATIEAMKAKRARDKARDEAENRRKLLQAESKPTGRKP